jgi:hypothetical protein
MRLGSPPGDVLDLSIVGYQFPEAADPGQRYSWHMIAGRASTPLQTWELRWSALTCDESVRLTGWLVQVAEAAARTTSDPEPALITQASFTEPDLAFAVLAVHDGQVTMRVELDLELHAPRCCSSRFRPISFAKPRPTGPATSPASLLARRLVASIASEPCRGRRPVGAGRVWSTALNARSGSGTVSGQSAASMTVVMRRSRAGPQRTRT